MKKINWRILGITCLVTLLPIVLGVIFWQRLPEEIAIHFNIHNEPDNYASKSVAVLKVAEELGIPTDRIITLGDNENDLSMFSITPHSFAVGNASDEIKKAASHVVGVGGLHGQVVRDVLNILF